MLDCKRKILGMNCSSFQHFMQTDKALISPPDFLNDAIGQVKQ